MDRQLDLGESGIPVVHAVGCGEIHSARRVDAEALDLDPASNRVRPDSGVCR
jgi:hypothetical protein